MDIEWIEADSVYCRLHHSGKSTLLRSSMERLERALDPSIFTRIHRSVIVRTDQVIELRPASYGDYVVRLRAGPELR